MGGLLFLVGVVDDLELPDEIAASALFRSRSFRWSLHRLALTLRPVDPGDAAALAFAGLGPEEEPPAIHAPPPTERQRAVLSSWVDRIVDEVRERLGWQDIASEVLLDQVCWRRALVMADPGWLEVHLSMDEVSTDIRRARLDLDPGFVPWLGAVLKFVYE